MPRPKGNPAVKQGNEVARCTPCRIIKDMARATKTPSRAPILQLVKTPLSFYVLALLIVEASLGLVLISGDLSQTLRFIGFLLMIAVFIGVLIFVGWLTVTNPRNLLYGKEEHLAPQLDDSALRDQIEDIVVNSVKPECLKNPQS